MQEYKMQIHLGLIALKPVSQISNKTRLKQVSSATETSWNIEISLEAILDMILSSEGITKAPTNLHECAGQCCSQTPEDRFSRVEDHLYCALFFSLCKTLFVQILMVPVTFSKS